MDSLIEDLKKGLEEAISYEKGIGEAKKRTYKIMPVKEYSSEEIRSIRKKAGMTQSVFAAYLGVSVKTVKTWEGGRTHPTGPALRLLDILTKDGKTDFVMVR